MRTNKHMKQKGFTLIELMMVVAVIGVLAMVAIPQYQKYVAKAEVAAALSLMTGVKTNVEAYTAEYGAFPAASESSALGVPSIIPQGTIAFEPDASSASGSIRFTFATDSSPKLVGSDFALVRSINGGWTCTASGATSAVESALLPKTCKS
ncbi:Belongs to the N-Me-Phe pilin family [Vibrio sp. B1REV9]|uniref:pilin n=1 Tax=Vibrio sp. B1REV9 TaxID=2751179 RepID=UPI001AFBEA22|nr:pilin [Vibrio sp. B1REV9]CAE6893252.1 Belongs to the N-Me-Phe pilin family [Vibrio sp. B1REV9]